MEPASAIANVAPRSHTGAVSAGPVPIGSRPIVTTGPKPIAAGISRVSRMVRRARPEDGRAQQALLLAGTIALLTFWTLSGASVR